MHLEGFWLRTAETSQDPEDPCFGPSFLDLDEIDRIEIIENWVNKAKYLFGDDITKHIRSLTDKQFSGYPGLVDENFSKPFDKYLKFE